MQTSRKSSMSGGGTTITGGGSLGSTISIWRSTTIWKKKNCQKLNQDLFYRCLLPVSVLEPISCWSLSSPALTWPNPDLIIKGDNPQSTWQLTQQQNAQMCLATPTSKNKILGTVSPCWTCVLNLMTFEWCVYRGPGEWNKQFLFTKQYKNSFLRINYKVWHQL